jgi:hypothetical protein
MALSLPEKPTALTTGEMTEEEVSAVKADFRKFLYLIFLHLGHIPSAVQYDIARYLQHGPRKKIICGFRGVGKTWITVCFALWCLYRNPQCKVFVVSASSAHAKSFVNFAIQLIYDVPFLKGLRPRSSQRQASDNFDVAAARPDRQPSLKAVGITSQLPGNRADVIIPDDVETPQTAGTVTQREKLLETIKEFGAILKPGGAIDYLGTPQTEDSIYPKLEQRGYTMRIWPSEVPDSERLQKYGHRLAPLIRNTALRDPSLVGKTTEPRFTDDDLQERRVEFGRSGYALQFMLDTSLSDADKYVLRLHDLIVTGLDRTHGPHTISWGNDISLIHKDLPIRGFNADKYYRPASISSERSPYDLVCGFIDPSGRGADECSLTVGAGLMGRVFVFNTWGWRDGYSDPTLKDIARLLVEFKVRKVRIESNFGDGMFGKLLKPHIDELLADHNKKLPDAQKLVIGIEEERAGNTQKEKRISDILGPSTQQHRIIVADQLITSDNSAVEGMLDVDAEKRLTYSWAYQYSRLTEERDCLVHDDRLESFAGLVNMFADALGINPGSAAKEKDAKYQLDEFNKLIEGAMRVAGPKDAKQSSKRDGFRPDNRPQRRH